ncbi:RNA polymerase small subunit [Acinetobacter phage VB_ApiP_XC38]|uniref:RNA polymerase small subunit n=1 Tax=Acinetobacter phage VB_ApiP_XC38 TaxID=2655002 RepID=A0A5P8PR91_9CAUD|nr:RNA polymerase small subunit [Acinetobacter phage VB_ApiP_XC38]QFR59776.1 RNA polymerase small subunit [Acinetobacter phage VB_ApiP_XC38]
MPMSREELIELQTQTEQMYSRKGIKSAVKAYMDTIPEVDACIKRGVALIEAWCQSPSSYASKQTRKDHISQMDLTELVEDVFIRIASLSSETTLNNLASQLAPSMGFDDTRVGIQAMAEIIAILCETDFYNLEKYHINSSIYVKSNFYLTDELQAYVERACYLPPLITKPKKLHNNRSSGYLTLKGESLILGGSMNHHNDPIALDVLNIMNRYRLSLNEWQLENTPELPTHDLDTVENAHELTEIELMKAVSQQKKNWQKHLDQSQTFYKHIVESGNKMYITTKVDKRGRIYFCGHHITPQGTSYKKSIVELYDKETIDVPSGYFG